MRLNSRFWLLPSIAGLMEASACVVIMETPSPESAAMKAASLGFLVGAVGAAALFTGWLFLARFAPAEKPSFRPLPILCIGIIALPVLWFWMAITNPWFAPYGALGLALAAALDTAATAAMLIPAYRWAGRRARWLWIEFRLGKETFRVTEIHPSLAVGAIAYETLFVLLQVLVNPYLHDVVRAGLAWFAIGFISALWGMLAMSAVRCFSKKLWTDEKMLRGAKSYSPGHLVFSRGPRRSNIRSGPLLRKGRRQSGKAGLP